MKAKVVSALIIIIVGFTLIHCEKSSPFEPSIDGVPGQSDPSGNNSDQVQPSVQYITANLEMGSRNVTQEVLDEVSKVTITFQDASVAGDIFGTLDATITYNVPASGATYSNSKHNGNGTLRLKGGKTISLIFKGTGTEANLKGTLWGYNNEGQLVLLAKYVESDKTDSPSLIITGEMYSDTLPAHNGETDPV